MDDVDMSPKPIPTGADTPPGTGSIDTPPPVPEAGIIDSPPMTPEPETNI